MQDYNHADIWLHQASQHLALINKAFQAQKADDSHTTLHYDPIHQRLVGQWVRNKEHKYLPTLDLKRLRLQWINLEFVPLAGLQLTEAFDRQQTSSFTELIPELDASLVPTQMHYEMPSYETSELAPSETSLATWQNYRRLALNASYEIIRLLGVSDPVHIWPHHFDTGIYVPVQGQQGIGYGLAMADSMQIGPYFYMASYDENGMINPNILSRLEPNQGTWIKEGDWTGAVLPISLLETSKNISELLTYWIQKSLYSFLSFKIK